LRRRTVVLAGWRRCEVARPCFSRPCCCAHISMNNTPQTMMDVWDVHLIPHIAALLQVPQKAKTVQTPISSHFLPSESGNNIHPLKLLQTPLLLQIRTRIHLGEIPPMRFHIRDQPRRIPLEQIQTPLKNLKIPCFHVNLILHRNVVLRADMHKPHRQQRDARHRIVIMRDPIIPARLPGDIVGEHRVSDARAAKRIQSGLNALVAQLGGRKRCDSAAERVPSHAHAVLRILSCSSLDSGGDGVSRVEPRLPEPRVRTAAGADIGGDEDEVEVREPVVDGLGAAERDDD
jgi:hypothetical protein